MYKILLGVKDEVAGASDSTPSSTYELRPPRSRARWVRIVQTNAQKGINKIDVSGICARVCVSFLIFLSLREEYKLLLFML